MKFDIFLLGHRRSNGFQISHQFRDHDPLKFPISVKSYSIISKTTTLKVIYFPWLRISTRGYFERNGLYGSRMMMGVVSDGGDLCWKARPQAEMERDWHAKRIGGSS